MHNSLNPSLSALARSVPNFQTNLHAAAQEFCQRAVAEGKAKRLVQPPETFCWLGKLYLDGKNCFMYIDRNGRGPASAEKAMRFMDCATEFFWPYRRRGGLAEPGDDEFNFDRKQAQADLRIHPEIEAHLEKVRDVLGLVKPDPAQRELRKSAAGAMRESLNVIFADLAATRAAVDKQTAALEKANAMLSALMGRVNDVSAQETATLARMNELAGSAAKRLREIQSQTDSIAERVNDGLKQRAEWDAQVVGLRRQVDYLTELLTQSDKPAVAAGAKELQLGNDDEKPTGN